VKDVYYNSVRHTDPENSVRNTDGILVGLFFPYYFSFPFSSVTSLAAAMIQIQLPREERVDVQHVQTPLQPNLVIELTLQWSTKPS
jgi:hypothetical protein